MKRALLIGSQTQGLSGVHRDIEAMDDVLSRIGFTTIPSMDGHATTDEILARYRGLIEDTGPDDIAVVYYSGHGGRMRNPLHAEDPTLPTWLQYIVPTDADDRSDERARCVLAEELSLLQWDLTEKTENVTVILDCCHAARMSRRGAALPKANDQLAFPEEDLVQRWRAARAANGMSADGNPNAVRVVACSPDQSAFEDYVPELGGRHGMLTAALVQILDKDLGITWSDALEVVRNRVVAEQRPDIEGPADRLLFSLQTRGALGVLPVRVKGTTALLPEAAVFGVTAGDRYALTKPGSDEPFAEAVVVRIVGADAVLQFDGDATQLPVGTSAWPKDVALTRRPVAVLPVDSPHRAELVAAFEKTAGVQPTDHNDGVLATAQIEEDTVNLFDVAGEPLFAQPMPFHKATDAVRVLAIADHVRMLPSGKDKASLPDDVTVSYHRLLPGGREVEVTSGEHLFVGDQLVVRCTNSSLSNRYVNVFDVGLAGAVTELTTSEGSGVTLARDETYELGREWEEGGLPLMWPETLPTGAPRLESFVTVIADRKVDALGRLGQPGVVRAAGGSVNDLARIVDDLAVGRRDVPRPGAGAGVRWRVDRFDFLLHPSARPAGDEPRFELEERPDNSFRLLLPRGVRPPKRIALRLKELTVHSNRSILKSRVRIDAVVITAAPAEEGGPYRASTMRFDRVKDGDRLPFDDVLIYEGPVARFLDIALWVAKDDSPDTDLADLLVTQTADEQVSNAVITLAALAVAAPAAAAIAGSVAAVAVLVRSAARVLEKLQGNSIGVYRTTLLPHQKFGAADGIGRHPEQGLLRANDMSFAFEVVAVDP
ncbi:caspase family protein [Kibdelosporangium aridum]|uniref:Caspase family protein n=1 Tax=Kibdelosporangium aridum TaxID=2030 RepID=A0A428ZL53_KIBAR|nr:caspase family protein [Kibdelosporangium aridum]RSM88691.1 caspase family protein [Kibdelosporangium aridum]